MKWIKVAETSIDRTTTKEAHAMEIISLGCIVSVVTKSEGNITETSVFVPGVRIKDDTLVAIDGFSPPTDFSDMWNSDS